MNLNNHVRPGEQLHFLSPQTVTTVGGEIPMAILVARGDTITLTADIIELAKDRNGDSWLDLLGDDDGQVERYGSVHYRPGPAPEDVHSWAPGSPEEKAEGERQRQVAWHLPDPEERKKELARVDRVFGRPKTSTTTWQLKNTPEEPTFTGVPR